LCKGLMRPKTNFTVKLYVQKYGQRLLKYT